MSVAKAVPLHRRVAAATERRWGALVAAVAVPILFLHAQYQPTIHVHVGSTDAGIELADIAVLAVAVAAAARLRADARRLRAGALVWTGAGALLLWIAIEAARTGHLADMVSAAKFGEYALLALSAPLVLRRRSDVSLVLGAFVAWSVAATFAGLLQFFGVSILHAWPAGRRQPSFLGHLDFAALSGTALVIGLVALTFVPLVSRRFAVAGIVSGVVGLILAGGSAGAVGAFLAIAALLVVAQARGMLSRRSLVAGVVSFAVVAVGVFAMRGNDFDQFLHYLRVRNNDRATRTHVETYVHHSLLAYLGWRIFVAHPIAGVGWQASSDPANYRPVLPAVHRKFPNVPAVAFPAPSRDYGIQNVYVQLLADLGIVGLVLWFAMYTAGILVALRTALRAPPVRAAVALAGGALLLLSLGLWLPQNLDAGLPLDALVWIALGVAAAAPVLD